MTTENMTTSSARLHLTADTSYYAVDYCNKTIGLTTATGPPQRFDHTVNTSNKAWSLPHTDASKQRMNHSTNCSTSNICLHFFPPFLHQYHLFPPCSTNSSTSIICLNLFLYSIICHPPPSPTLYLVYYRNVDCYPSLFVKWPPPGSPCPPPHLSSRRGPGASTRC